MFVHYRTLGLVLKKENRGEADNLFTVYTKDFGKLTILGKAIRKIASKLRAGMEVFSVSEIEFIQGKGYKTLTDAVLVERFGNLNKDLGILKTANKISGIVDGIVKGQEPDEEIWNLLLMTFQKLNNCRGPINDCQKVYYYFLWNFFSILGYQPEIYECISCRKKILPEKNYLRAKDGGIICGNCAKGAKSEKELDLEVIKILRIILKKDWKVISKLRLSPERLKNLETASQDYIRYISEMTG